MKIKNPLGRGSYIPSGIWGMGVRDVFHWFLLSLKVIVGGGAFSGGLQSLPPDPVPPPPTLYPTCSVGGGGGEAANIRKCINVYPILVKRGKLAFYLFIVRFR